MYLLDTNVVSELRCSERADAKVLAWASSVASAEIFLSAVTVLELELGVLSVERRDAAQGQFLRAWLDGQVLPRFSGRVLPLDVAVARACARLHVPDRQSERDAMIAATAMVHGLTVVTRNVRDFAASKCRLLNPWTEPDA
jgi:toxin FitB